MDVNSAMTRPSLTGSSLHVDPQPNVCLYLVVKHGDQLALVALELLEQVCEGGAGQRLDDG